MKNYQADNEKSKKGLLRQLLAASQIGLHMVAATFAGLAIGYFLDKFFETSPALTIIFLLIGIAAGFIELFRFAKKQAREHDNEGL